MHSVSLRFFLLIASILLKLQINYAIYIIEDFGIANEQLYRQLQQTQMIKADPINNVHENVDSDYRLQSDFKVINEWKYLDFEYPSFVQRQRSISKGEFIPKNNLPLGVDFYRDRIFISTPRWKDGVPASFGTIPYPPKEISPPIVPYPNWEAHGDPLRPDCSKLMSVYRTAIDPCGRLWLIDSGVVNATVKLNQICPPKIVAFDLGTDKMIISYEIPSTQVKEDSLHSNIVVDVRGGHCDDAHIYVTDVWRFGIIVYSLAKNRSWRITNYNFYPNPMASDFSVYGLNFQWLDGVFGMSLSIEKNADRVLYFHPMASYKEFMVSANLLRDESLWPVSAENVAKYFIAIGDRGFNGQSSTSGIDRDGVMFYTQVHSDNIGCWDTAKTYQRVNLKLLIDKSASILQFPNDLKVDQEPIQGVWVMSNKLPIYLYSQLNYDEINFRIIRANVKDVVSKSICDINRNAINENNLTVTVQEGQCY